MSISETPAWERRFLSSLAELQVLVQELEVCPSSANQRECQVRLKPSRNPYGMNLLAHAYPFASSESSIVTWLFRCRTR